jgi:hypothetical protein
MQGSPVYFNFGLMKKILLNAVWLVACLFVAFAALPVQAQLTDDDNRVADEFIVMMKPGHSINQLLAEPVLKDELQLKECLSKRMGIYWLQRNSATGADVFLHALQRNPHVKLAQFNHRNVQERSLIPDDPDFNLQWNMLNTGQLSGVPGTDIDATEAWSIDTSNVTKNGDTIVVAIIDKLFDLDHEDLNYFINYGEIPNNGIDDDGNGYIDDVNGWNATTNNGDVRANNSVNGKHATHCAGIAGAKGNNGKCVAGVCWGAKILPIYGSSTDEVTVVKAYDYVLNMRTLYNNTFGTQGAFVVATNSSFGVDNGNPVNFPIWCAMYDTMGYEGILSAAATSNSTAVNVEVNHDMPTECPSPWLIGVTSTSGTDFRNGGYGKVSIDLGAPGFGIQSTVYPNTYASNTGTSMATPHVAGTVAAMYGAACKGLIDKYYEQPDSIALLIKKYILDGVEWTTQMNNLTTSNGRLNLYRAFMNLKQYNCDSCNFDIELEKVPISCRQADNGAMAVHSSSINILNANIHWSNGLTTPECLNMAPGFYTVQVTDSNNCRRTLNAELHNPDTVVIAAVNVSPPVGGNSGSLTIVALAGNEPLLYSINGSDWQTTATFSIPTDSTYTVYVKNTTGCITTKEVLVTGLDELAANLNLTVYPNPADDRVIVTGNFSAKAVLEVFDIAGRKMLEARAIAPVYSINTAAWNAGIYILRIQGTERKLVIAR